MTVSALYEPDVYNGDGSLDTFPVTFDFLSTNGYLKVSLKNETTLVYTNCSEHLQYEVVGANIVFNVGYIPTTNDLVIIEFYSDWFQSSDYVENSALPAENMEDDFDKLKLEVQALRDSVARALRMGPEVDLDTTDPTDYFDISLTPELEALADVSAELLQLASIEDELTALVAVDDDLLDIAANWTPASASGAASLRFKEDSDNGTSGVYIKAPASLSGDVTLTLPDNDGASAQALLSDGSGNLYWGNGTATAAGDTYDVQYNTSDALDGNSNFTTDGAGAIYSGTTNTRNTLTVGSNLTGTRGKIAFAEQGTVGVPTGHAVNWNCPANGTMSGNINFYIPYVLPLQSGSVLICTDAGVMSWYLPTYNLNNAWNAATTLISASIDFAEGTNNGGNYIRLKGADSLSGNVTLTLPNSDGDSGQSLITDGSGVLSWTTITGGVGMPAGAVDGDVIYTDVAGTGLAKLTNFNFSTTRLLIPTDLTIYGKTSTASSLNLYDSDKSHTFTWRTPALSSNVILIVPDSVGTVNHVLITNGSSPATLSWSDVTTLVSAASDTVAGKIEIAVQSEMEAGTDTGRAVTPGRQHFHPSAAKAWLHCPDMSAATPAFAVSYNMTSITDNGTGDYTFTIATDFSGTEFCSVVSGDGGGTQPLVFASHHVDASNVRVYVETGAGTDTDATELSMVMYGDL
jgi:hypothetical protein